MTENIMLLSNKFNIMENLRAVLEYFRRLTFNKGMERSMLRIWLCEYIQVLKTKILLSQAHCKVLRQQLVNPCNCQVASERLETTTHKISTGMER